MSILLSFCEVAVLNMRAGLGPWLDGAYVRSDVLKVLDDLLESTAGSFDSAMAHTLV